MTDTEMPLAAGRELWGFAKKMAHITLDRGADMIWGSMERPKGYRICSAGKIVKSKYRRYSFC
jgi:acetoacetate decarboxylase